MADEDEDRSPSTPDDDELASKLARLSEEQQARYQREVHNTVERNVEVSQEYRLKLADTLLKDLPARAKNLEIRDLNNRQAETKLPVQEPANPEPTVPNPASKAQPNPENSLEGKQPSGPSRDY